MPGLSLGHRMTVVRLGSGDLWLHSPVRYDPSLAAELSALGPVAHLVAPSTFHDLYWSEWFANFPAATFHSAPGVKEEHSHLPFGRVLNPNRNEPWETEIRKLLVAGMPKLNENVFLHHPSRTLIVADLVFNIPVDEQNLVGKFFLKLNNIYDRVGCSRFFRRYIKDQPAFRQSISEILTWDFDRIILGHGPYVEKNGKAVLRDAMAWLCLDQPIAPR